MPQCGSFLFCKGTWFRDAESKPQLDLQQVVLNDLRVVRSAGGAKYLPEKDRSGEGSKGICCGIGKGVEARNRSGDTSATAGPVPGKAVVEKDSGRTLARSEIGGAGEARCSCPVDEESNNRERAVKVRSRNRLMKQRLRRSGLQGIDCCPRKCWPKRTRQRNSLLLQAEIEAMKKEMQSIRPQIYSAEIASAKGELEQLSPQRNRRRPTSEQLASLTAEADRLRREIKAAEETTPQEIVAAKTKLKTVRREGGPGKSSRNGTCCAAVGTENAWRRREASQKKARGLALRAELEILRRRN